MKQLLEERLGDYAFHKSIFPGPDEASDAAFNFKLWRDADKRGMAATVLLRDAVHGQSGYRVYAYSVHGDIPAELLQQLQEIVNVAELGEIRYESFGVKGFSCLYDEQGECFQEDYTLLPLYQQMDGVFLAIVVEHDGDASELDCPVAVYAVNDNGMYQWCVAQKYLDPAYAYPPTDEDPDTVPEDEEDDDDVVNLLAGALGVEEPDFSSYTQMMSGVQNQEQAMDMAGRFFAMGAEAAQNMPDNPTEEEMAKAYQEMMSRQMAAFGAMMGQMYGKDTDEEES